MADTLRGTIDFPAAQRRPPIDVPVMNTLNDTGPDARPAGPALATAASFEFPIDLGPDFLQTVDFDLPSAPPLTMDEPAPLGTSAGPNPARLLAAAVGGCLAASLAFCLRKSRISVERIRTTVRGTLVRNERGRMRVGSVAVLLEPVVRAADYDRIPRCLEVFEDYCVVTASIRSAIPVDVQVEPTLTAGERAG